VAEDSLERPYTTEGLSEGLSEGEPTLETGAQEGALPEEYRPYSNIPWNEIPEHAREDVLKAVKTFQAGMTRSSQEAAELRREAPELRQKAEVLERLTADPGFNQWYQQRYYGAPAQQQQQAPQGQPTEKLREFLDADGVNALNATIQQAVHRAVAPLHQRLEQVNQSAVTDRATRDLENLKQEVAEKGWPSVDEHISQMTNLLSQRRATDVRDAYFLATKESLVEAEVKRALKAKQDRLQQKADTTFKPNVGPAASPGEEVFHGEEATLQAYRAAKREAQAQGYRIEE
jgi:hypothetical protein